MTMINVKLMIVACVAVAVMGGGTGMVVHVAGQTAGPRVEPVAAPGVTEQAEQAAPKNVSSDDSNLGLLEYEKSLKTQLATGWVPPWSNLNIKASETEIRDMGTKELAVMLLATGIYERQMMAMNNPDTILLLKRLEVFYKGYAELFARKDLGLIFASGIETSAKQLNPEGKFVDNSRILTRLEQLPQMYDYPPIKKNIVQHDQALFKAYIVALSEIGRFYNTVAEKDIQMGENYNYLKIADASTKIVSSALSIADRLDPPNAALARSAIPILRADPSKLPTREEVVQYTAKAVIYLQKVAN